MERDQSHAGRSGGDGTSSPAFLRTLRDRLVSNPGFRRWAARFPLTRPIARRRTRELFDLCAGFVYAQVLHACVELDVFTMLAERPRNAGELAARVGLPVEGAERLLQAAVALRLADRRRGGRFGLGALGAALVGNAGIAAMVRHHAMLYADLADPVGLLRGAPGAARLAGYWDYGAGEAGKVAAYTALMAASQPLVAGEILDAYAPRRHRCLMDVGGGDGTFLVEAGRRAAGLQLVLFDIPPVASAAERRFAAAGLSARARAVGGSFLTDRLPGGADLISLVRVVHDHDDSAAMILLRAVHDALPRDGTLLLAEPMADTRGAERMGDAYFGFYLLAMGRGRPRRAAELTDMLRQAGFGRVRQAATSTPLLTSVLIAHPA